MQSSDIKPTLQRYIDLIGQKPVAHKSYANNSIISSRYSKLNFIPKALLLQFFSISKIWFLLISILELLGLSETSLPFSTVLPLFLLILIELIREGFNDFQRHKSDQEMNSQLQKVWDGNEIVEIKCSELHVGQVVLLINQETAPADLLLLCVGNEEHECYADVSSVLGECNLKRRHPVKDVQSKVDCLDLGQACLLLKMINADILASQPTRSFKSFSGKFKLDVRPSASLIDSDNLLLRGMKVQNTEWVLGLVVYAGVETKIWINNLNQSSSGSRIWKIMEKWNVLFLSVILSISLISTLISLAYPSKPYKPSEIFLGNLVLFNHFIQISLYLSIEVVRLFTFLINMFFSCIQLKNFRIFSNLGMIEYIVTDKTGTLTQNFLDVALLIIGNRLYINEEQEDQDHSERMMMAKRKIADRIDFDYSRFIDLETEIQSSSDYDLFLTCLALCNLSFPADDTFVAMSEDDKVLARTAAKFGYRMIFRSPDLIILSLNNEEVAFDILGIQSFSSDTKKSRIVVRKQETNEVFLFVKGSRESMINIYDSSYERHDIEDCIIQFRTLFLGFRKMEPQEIGSFVFDYQTALLTPINKQGRVENIFKKIEKNSKFLGIVGLEDLISDETKETVGILKNAGIKFWVVSGDAEESTLTAAVAADVFSTEHKIVRLGGFSSELECMNSLQEAIKENVFSSKGSERPSIESEIQIPRVKEAKSEMMLPLAQSVNSLSVEDMIPLAVPRRNRRRSTLLVRDEVRKPSIHPLMAKLPIKRQITSLEGEYNPKNMKFVLSLDSSCLEYGMSSKEHQKCLTALLFTAKAVCFHGILPDQKTKVVKIIKFNFNFSPVVLSVGDGASDIGMIRVADIGVAIQGKDGVEAGLNADVILKNFSQLKELILEKGHRHYIQFSKMILLSVYVMILLESQLVFYNPISRWTASSVLLPELSIIYRLVINIFPIACMCIFDSDCSSSYLTPKVYKAGIFNSLLNLKNVVFYILAAMIQAGFTFLCTMLYFQQVDLNGKTENYMLISVSVFFIISTTVFITILIETYSIHFKILGLYVFSIVLMIVCTVPLTETNENLLGFSQIMIESSNLWVYLCMTVLFNSLVIYCFKVLRYLSFPSIIEKVRQMAPSASFRLDNRLSQYKKTLKCVYRESGNLVNHSTYDDNAINFKTLKFFSKQRERLYQMDKLAENAKDFKIFVMIACFSTMIYTIYILSYYKPGLGSILFHLLSSLLMLSSTFLPKILNFQTYSLIYLFLSYFLIETFYLISQVAFEMPCLPMLTYLPVIYLIGFSNFWFEMNILALSNSIISVIISAFVFSSKGPNSLSVINIFDYSIVYLCLLFTSSLIAYHIDKSKREEFVLVQKVQVEITKRNCVLSYLLPAFVMKRVENGIRYISIDQGVISVIFCDIYNFESILKSYSPQELATFLDEVYQKFDQICTLTGCTKIETVGKTYMACAGLQDSEVEMDPYYTGVPHARRCIEMGLAIIRNSEKIYLKNREVLQFNIGINSGPVTAGVVGFHKPQFSLVGDTVNTASRMASLCPSPNTLQISSETKELIGDLTGLTLESSQVDAKGKGIMKTFLVSVPEISSEQSPTKNLSIVGSMSKIFALEHKRNHRTTKKITLYQMNNAHEDNNKRKSSLIDELGVQVAVGNEFVKKKTMGLEKVNFFSVGFKESAKESKFRIKTSENTFPIVKYGLFFRVICNTLLIVLNIIKLALDESQDFEGVIKLVLELAVVIVLMHFLEKHYKKLWFCWTMVIVFIIGAVFRFSREDLHHELIFIKYIYHMLQAAHCSHLLFKNLKSITCFAVLAQVIFASVTRHSNWILQILASLTFFIILLFSVYTRENKLRVFTTLKKAALKKIDKSEALLAEMMPKNAYENMRDYISVTESISQVTLLYADIVGFTAWSANKKPNEVVNMLSELFQEFDKKCKELEVYKVHTIGDCYVAMGYTGVRPRSENNECFRLANFALELVEIIKRKNKENNTELNMRIGMHTGNLIGGIAGTSIVRYDIYGVSVYIANKMESSGKAGCVKVSESTMEILHNHWPQAFTFNRDEDVYAKVSNSRIKTYYMEKSFIKFPEV
jgi:magnesium-transporting ATPase (P-type)/class 3 adenylate cyclase